MGMLLRGGGGWVGSDKGYRDIVGGGGGCDDDLTVFRTLYKQELS
jgi:hypothetical protein